VAHGRTVAEALQIARDVARKLIEARRERDGIPNLFGRIPLSGIVRMRRLFGFAFDRQAAVCREI